MAMHRFCLFIVSSFTCVAASQIALHFCYHLMKMKLFSAECVALMYFLFNLLKKKTLLTFKIKCGPCQYTADPAFSHCAIYKYVTGSTVLGNYGKLHNVK